MLKKIDNGKKRQKPGTAKRKKLKQIVRNLRDSKQFNKDKDLIFSFGISIIPK